MEDSPQQNLHRDLYLVLWCSTYVDVSWKREVNIEMAEVADSVKLFRVVKMVSNCEKLQKVNDWELN